MPTPSEYTNTIEMEIIIFIGKLAMTRKGIAPLRTMT